MNPLRIFLSSCLLAALLAATPKQAPPFIEVNVGLSGVGGYEVRWGYYDNDGLLDLAVEGFNGSRWVRIYRNTGGAFVEDPGDAGLLGLNEGPCIWGDFDN